MSIKKTWVKMLMEALFILAPSWEKPSHLSTHEWIIKCGLVIPWITLCNKKEQSIETYYKMRGFKKYYCEQRKPDTGKYTPYNSIWWNSRIGESNLWCRNQADGCRGDWLGQGMRGISGKMEVLRASICTHKTECDNQDLYVSLHVNSTSIKIL